MRFLKNHLRLVTIIVFTFTIMAISSNMKAQNWSSIGTGGGGWITAMTVVNDNAHTTYVGCDVGGIYKSTDQGQTWTIKNTGLPMYFMHDIAHDNTNPNTLYLACRGGVFKSTDGGEHWVAKRDHFPAIEEFKHSAPISDIAIAPSNQDIIYAGVGVPNTGYELNSYHWQSVSTKGAIYKSTDGAETWTLIHNTGIDIEAMVYSLTIHPTNPDIVYAATSKGVYKTINAGSTWALKNSGIPHGLTMKIVISPTTPNTLYVSIWAEPGSGTWQGGIYKTTDGGNNWLPKSNGLPQVVKPERGLTTNFPSLIINENNPNILYTGNIAWDPEPGVFKTIDGGDHWTLTTQPDDPNSNVEMGWIVEHGVSASVIAIDQKTPERLYFGTSMHVFTTDNAGIDWNQVYTTDMGNGYWQGNGLETTVNQAIAIDPNDPNKIYAGYWDIGFFKSTDAGQSFKKVNTGFGDYDANTFDILIDPDNSANLYAANGWWESNKGAVYKSTNFGENWAPLTNGLPDAQVWSIALDKNSLQNSRTIYAASYKHGVFKSTDDGQSWVAKNTGLGIDENLQVKKIVIDPNNSQILYAGIEAYLDEADENNLQTDKGGIFKSTNAGDTWARIGTNQITVWDIDIDPDNSQVLFTSVKSEYDHSTGTTYIGGVYKSTDAGATWNAINTGLGASDNLNISSLVIDPTNTNTLYAATTDQPYHDESSGRGLFKSTDGGLNWVPFNEGLGILNFEILTLGPNSNTLYAGSGGNGLLKREISAPLALEWSFFQVKKQINNALLTWATTVEENVSHFDILRRFDGKNWQQIGKIKASGSSTSAQKYQFIDPNVPANDAFSETAYYQLRAIDFDGKRTWNEIKSLSWDNEQTSIFVYPNPATNLISVQNLLGTEIKNISIYNATGKLMLLSEKSNQMDVSSLKAGLYQVQIITQNQIFKDRLIIK